MPLSPTPTPPGETSPNIMCSIGDRPPSGVYESCMLFTAPVEVPVVAPANRPLPACADAHLLAFDVAARLRDRQRLVGAGGGEVRVAVLFGEHGEAR